MAPLGAADQRFIRSIFPVIDPLRYSGSPREVGSALAKALGRLPMPAVQSTDIGFARACRDAAIELNPVLSSLYEGFLAGGGWDPDQFLAYFFARRQGMLRGCTNFAATGEVTSDGDTLVGRNYDWAYSDLPYCEARAIDIQDALSFVSYTHHWIGHPDCLNEAGLFVAISSLPAAEASHPGIQWNLLVDAIAMSCRSVEEAVVLLEKANHLRSITYLLADDSDAAAVEATCDRVTVRPAVGGIAIATNHAVGFPDGSDRARHSIARYDRAESRLRSMSPSIDELDVIDLLRDPVCTIRDGKRFLHELDHVPLAALEDWGTIWSTVCRPSQAELMIARGHPNDAPYEPVRWLTNPL